MSHITEAAVILQADGEFVLQEVYLDDLQADEALIEVHACGICHMDQDAGTMLKPPYIAGHEGAGIVISVGAGVTGVKPGDRVILGYGFCGHCSPCKHGRPFFCDNGWELTFGGTRLDGSPTVFSHDKQALNACFFQQSSFARHAITPARSLVRIGDEVPWHVAAAIPCGFLTGAGTAQNVLSVNQDSTLLICGAGAVGLGAVAAARKLGCGTIVVTDIRENRLALAREFGATHCINTLATDFDEWAQQFFFRGFSHAIDTTGNAAVFTRTMNCLATGGEMAYVTLPVPMEEFEFKPFPLFVKCASLKAVSFGSSVPGQMLPQLLEWWKAGDFPVEKAIECFEFEKINQAMAANQSGKCIKPVLVMV